MHSITFANEADAVGGHSRLDSVTAPIIALADLVEMKRRAGRAQDLLDVEALEALGQGNADE